LGGGIGGEREEGAAGKNRRRNSKSMRRGRKAGGA